MPKYWGKQIFTHGRFPEVGQKQKTEKRENTPGTAGGPGGRDLMLAVKSKKNRSKITFFLGEKILPKKHIFFGIYLLDMPKYWGKQSKRKNAWAKRKKSENW